MNTMTLDRIAPVATSTLTPAFTIERGIPIPPRTYGAGSQPVYPFAQMRVGDSFEVRTENYAGRKDGRRPIVMRIQTTLHSCARGYARTRDPGAKFTVRKIDDSTVRIWRVA